MDQGLNNQQPQPIDIEQVQNAQESNPFWLPRSGYVRYGIVIGLPFTVAILFCAFTFGLLSVGDKSINQNMNLILYFHKNSQTFRTFVPEIIFSTKLIDLFFVLSGVSIGKKYKYAIVSLPQKSSKLEILSTGFLADPFSLFEQQIQEYDHAIGIVSLEIETISQPVMVYWLPDSVSEATKNAYIMYFHRSLVSTAFPSICIIEAKSQEDIQIKAILKTCIEQIGFLNIAGGASYTIIRENRLLEQNDQFSIKLTGTSRDMLESFCNESYGSKRIKFLQYNIKLEPHQEPNLELFRIGYSDMKFQDIESLFHQVERGVIFYRDLGGSTFISAVNSGFTLQEKEALKICLEKTSCQNIKHYSKTEIIEEFGEWNSSSSNQVNDFKMQSSHSRQLTQENIEQLSKSLNKMTELLYRVINRFYKYSIVDFERKEQDDYNTKSETGMYSTYNDFIKNIRNKGFRIAFYQFVFEKNAATVIIIWKPELIKCEYAKNRWVYKLIQEISQIEETIPIIIASSIHDISLFNLAKIITLSSIDSNENQNRRSKEYLKVIWNLKEE